MGKIWIGLMVALVVVFIANAIDKIVIPYQPAAGSIISSTQYKRNNDTIASKFNKQVDTLGVKFPRWTAFSNHDSTFRWMNIDTIPSADTIYSAGIKSLRLKVDNAATLDSIRSRIGNIDTVSSYKVRADSASIRHAKIDTVRGIIARPDTVDTRKIRVDSISCRAGKFDIFETDSISFTKLSTDSISFGGDYLKYHYKRTAVPCTLYCNNGITDSTMEVGTAYLTRTGSTATMYVPGLNAVATRAVLGMKFGTWNIGNPDFYGQTFKTVSYIMQNDVEMSGLLLISSGGGFLIKDIDGSDLSGAGQRGIANSGITITWVTND